AGGMGGDSGGWSAWKGSDVTLQDREQGDIDKARGRAQERFAKTVKEDARRQEVAAPLKSALEGAGLAEADLVIEAIIEDADAKRGLYAQVEPQLPDGALLTSNTSSIPLAELAEGLRNPARFAGLHYFNPLA